MVEAEISNGGYDNLIDLYQLYLFLSSSKKVLKGTRNHVMTVFLEPFIKEFVSSFIDGFDVIYCFPSKIISPTITLATETNSF